MKKLVILAICGVAAIFAAWGDCGTTTPNGSETGDGSTVGSVDPNEIAGPLGVGEKRYVQQGEWMDYTIYFENKTNATAAAQEVFVDLPMDENLDWTTLELGEISFGDHIDTSLVGNPPAKKAKLLASYPLPGTNTFVKTTVTMKDGILSWYMRDWDPTTADNFPASATGGFLPPNDPETHCGEGHLSFRVRVKSDAPDGAVIRASAQIVFDSNPMIETDPSWWNTVGEDKPTASFTASEVEVAEGDVLTFVVTGGNVDAASSVDVYLTYNTATSADLDPAKAKVNGVLSKNLKFPLTLNWAKDEVGEKVIEIPVKTDKTVEGDEFLTLQLANAVGMVVGDEDICTVTITDANTYATLQDGVMNPNIKVSTSGDGKWIAGAGSRSDEDGSLGLFHVETPTLAKGKKSTLSFGTMKGAGEFSFYVRFTGDPNEETPSSLAIYNGKSLLGALDHTQVSNVWDRWYIDASKASSSSSHNYSFVFTQGSDPNTHAEVADILWDTGSATPIYNVLACTDGTGGGYVSGAGPYLKGQTAKLVAKPLPGWVFDGWYMYDKEAGAGDLWNKSASVSLKPTGDLHVIAVFSKIPYVRGLADPADGGKVSGSGLCAAGKKVTLKASANKNFTFLGWVRGGPRGTALPGDGDGRAGSPLPAADGEFVATTPSLVIDRSAKPAANTKTSTTITNVTEDVTYFAVFRSDPKVTVSVEATDGKGSEPTGKGAGKYVAGTITGMGKYAPGKKVTLKAAANKGYVFAGWFDADSELLTKNATYTVASMGESDVEYTARFVTADEDKASIALGVNGAALSIASGDSPTSTNIWAGVYLEWPVAASALSETKVKVAGLPSGLKFTDKPVTSKIGSGKTAVMVTNVPANTIYGAPTAASKVDAKTKAVKPSEVKLTVTTAGKSSRTYQIDTVVDALPTWAQGTFAGGWEPEDAATSGGTVSLTVDAKGKVSGKALGDGLTYTLAAPYYSAFALDENQSSNFLADVTATWSYKEGTKTIKTNDVVQLVVQDNIIGGYAAVEDWFDAYTANWKVEPWKALGKKFDKATMVYAILSNGTLSDDEEYDTVALGEEVTGRVTLKFAATGAVTIAGEFVSGAYNDKTKKYPTVKATGSATLVPVDEEHGEVFIYLTPKGFPPHTRCVTVPWPEE